MGLRPDWTGGCPGFGGACRTPIADWRSPWPRGQSFRHPVGPPGSISPCSGTQVGAQRPACAGLVSGACHRLFRRGPTAATAGTATATNSVAASWASASARADQDSLLESGSAGAAEESQSDEPMQEEQVEQVEQELSRLVAGYRSSSVLLAIWYTVKHRSRRGCRCLTDRSHPARRLS